MKICSPELSDSFLAGALSADQESSFAEHLESCPCCRELLEAKAATPSEWQTARELLAYAPGLSSDAIESDPLESVHYLSSLSFLAPSDDPAMLGRLGTYEIIGLLGRGGTGIVLKGFDRTLNRNVALKVLDPTAANIGAARERFAREARAMAAITHEHVVPVYGVDEHQRLPYFVMEYVAGGSLDRRLLADGPLEVLSIVRIGLQVAQALDAAHQQGLVHRDIKPGNILLDKGIERVRVADFGLARVANDISCTRSGFIAGTPQYMAPEQVRAETCDARADLFSLGAVMYAMCTGHPPFRAETVYAVMQRIVHDEPRSIREQNPKIPMWLEQFIMRLLHKEKEQRFASASEVAKLLQEELAYLQNPVAANKPRRAWFDELQAAAKKSRRRKIGLAVVCLITVVAGTYVRDLLKTETLTQTPTNETITVDLNDTRIHSTVTLWNQDSMRETQAKANNLEQMLHPELPPQQTDSWQQQLEQLKNQIDRFENRSRVITSPQRNLNSNY